MAEPIRPHGGDMAAAISGLSPADHARLKAIARLRAQGLPRGIGWADLLQEAMARALSGSRRLPPDVKVVAFLAGVMRSIASEVWRRSRTEADILSETGELPGFIHDDAPRDPERTTLAIQALSLIHRMFATDPDVLKVLSGLADELTAEEIRHVYGLSVQDYDNARKRLRRAMTRWALRDGAP